MGIQTQGVVARLKRIEDMLEKVLDKHGIEAPEKVADGSEKDNGARVYMNAADRQIQDNLEGVTEADRNEVDNLRSGNTETNFGNEDDVDPITTDKVRANAPQRGNKPLRK